MFAPIRALLAPRRGAPVVLLVAAAAVSFLFAATPFLIPEVAERYGVAVGTAGFISAAQVTGFAVTTFVAGRWWRPSRSKLVVAALVGAGFNAASAMTESFPLLLGFRLGAGAAAGVFTWLAWAAAMRDVHSMRDIAAVGPVTVLVAAPLLAWVAAVGGDRAVYWVLAASPLPAALFPAKLVGASPRERSGMSPSRSNIVLLVALGALTMAGSALFVFLGALAQDEIGMGAVALSFGFSLNAMAGLAGARWRRRPRHAWPWMALTAVSAGSVVLVPNEIVFYVGLIGWGFAFWMAVPRVLGAVADWSFAPDERVGDAQSIMAVGRAIGPAIGGVLVGAGAYGTLGAFAAIGLGSAALLVGLVERYRVDRDAPPLP